jgi:hypothetical protein
MIDFDALPCIKQACKGTSVLSATARQARTAKVPDRVQELVKCMETTASPMLAWYVLAHQINPQVRMYDHVFIESHGIESLHPAPLVLLSWTSLDFTPCTF